MKRSPGPGGDSAGDVPEPPSSKAKASDGAATALGPHLVIKSAAGGALISLRLPATATVQDLMGELERCVRGAGWNVWGRAPPRPRCPRHTLLFLTLPPRSRLLDTSATSQRVKTLHVETQGECLVRISGEPAEMVAALLTGPADKEHVVVYTLADAPEGGNHAAAPAAMQGVAASGTAAASDAAPEADTTMEDAPGASPPVLWLFGLAPTDPALQLCIVTLHAKPLHVRVPVTVTLAALSDALLQALLPAHSVNVEAPLHVTVAGPGGAIWQLTLAAGSKATVGSLVGELQATAPALPSDKAWSLTFNGRFLRDASATLLSYGCGDGCTISAAEAERDEATELACPSGSPASHYISTCIDIDLFTAAHGLYSCDASVSASLADLGLVSAAGTGELAVYAHLRQAPSRNSGGARTQAVSCFDYGCAWQPSWRPEEEQKPEAMAALLASLRCLAADPAIGIVKAEEAAAALRSAVPFPPAAAALRKALCGRELLDADKAALAAGLASYIKAQLPVSMQADAQQLFEHAPRALAVLVSQAVALPGGAAGEWATLPLHDAVDKHARIKVPVRIRGKGDAPHCQQRLEERQASKKVKASEVTADAETQALLLVHPPPALDATLWTPPAAGADADAAQAAAAAARKAATALAASPEAWEEAAKEAEKKVPCLAPVAPMVLKRGRAPLLTRGPGGTLCAFLGVQNSGGKPSLFDPLRRSCNAIDPDELAKKLDDKRPGTAADDRVPEEVLVVCLDVSRSMQGDYSAEEVDGSAAAKAPAHRPPPAIPSVELMQQALDKLRRRGELPHLAAIWARSTHTAGVMQLLAEEDDVLAAMLAPGRQELRMRVEAVLRDAVPVPGAELRVTLPPAIASAVSMATTSLAYSPNHTVHMLTYSLQNTLGVPAQHMKLRLQSGATPDKAPPLSADLTLSAAGIGPGSQLVLTLVRHGASKAPQPQALRPLHFKFKKWGSGHSWPVTADASSSVRHLLLRAYELGSGAEGPAAAYFAHGQYESGDGVTSFHHGATLGAADDRHPYQMSRQFREETSRGEGSSSKPIIVVFWRVGTKAEKEARQLKKQRTLSRLEAVQELFTTFANRLAAFDLPVHVAMLTFGSDVTEVSPVTPLIERFIGAVRSASPDGDTALWDCIDEGMDVALAALPGVTPLRRRLLVLSDGQDSCSSAEAHELACKAMSKGVTIDAILLGDAHVGNNSPLRALTQAAGGLCFAPANLTVALKHMELETLLSAGERAAPAFKAKIKPESEASLVDLYGGRGTLYTRLDQMPPRRTDVLLSQAAVKAEEALRRGDDAAAVSTRSPHNVRKIMQELRAVTSTSVDSAMGPLAAQMDVFPSVADIGYWRVLLPGKEKTPYEKGTFLLSIRFPPSYPAFPPEVRFETAILHPNVNASGRICSALLGPEWSDDGGNRMPTVLLTINSLFAFPEISNPVNTALALDYFTSAGVEDTSYAATIARHVALHASKSREAYRVRAPAVCAILRTCAGLDALCPFSRHLHPTPLRRRRWSSWLATAQRTPPSCCEGMCVAGRDGIGAGRGRDFRRPPSDGPSRRRVDERGAPRSPHMCGDNGMTAIRIRIRIRIEWTRLLYIPAKLQRPRRERRAWQPTWLASQKPHFLRRGACPPASTPCAMRHHASASWLAACATPYQGTGLSTSCLHAGTVKYC